MQGCAGDHVVGVFASAGVIQQYTDTHVVTHALVLSVPFGYKTGYGGLGTLPLGSLSFQSGGKLGVLCILELGDAVDAGAHQSGQFSAGSGFAGLEGAVGITGNATVT